MLTFLPTGDMPLPRLIPLFLATLALLAAPAGAVVMAPVVDETPLAALEVAWNRSAEWDAVPPLFPQDKAPAADRLAPGESLPNALTGDTPSAGAFDFAAPPDPRNPGEPNLTKLLAALLALAALARYSWRDFLSEIYYPVNY